MIQSPTDFIKFFSTVQCWALNYICVLSEDRLDWSPKKGEFTCNGKVVLEADILDKLGEEVVDTADPYGEAARDF